MDDISLCKRKWCNRNVVAFGLTSFLSDFCHEMATSILPQFMQAIGVTRVVALLYLLRNVVYTIASYPIGALSSRFTRSRYLATGYGVAVITFAGFTFVVGSIWWFIIFFSLAGIFIAWEDTVEGIAVRDYVDDTIAGTAYGILGVVNGFGDFTSSLIVGILWTAVGASWGFAYAFIVCIAGVLAMARVSSLEKADHDL